METVGPVSALRRSGRGREPRPQEPERVFQVCASGAVTLSDTPPTPKPDSADDGDDGWARFELDPRWMFELLYVFRSQDGSVLEAPYDMS